MTSALISALMTLALGILFVILKAEVIGIAITVIGIALIVVAIIDLVKRNFVSAVIKAVLGILVLVIGWTVLDIALLIIGIVLLVYGILELVKRIFGKKGKNQKFWQKLLGFVQPIFCIVASILLITNSGQVLDWAIIIPGIFFIIDGVLGIINALSSKKK